MDKQRLKTSKTRAKHVLGMIIMSFFPKLEEMLHNDELESAMFCPYCGDEVKRGGCCGESTSHMEEHSIRRVGKYDVVFVDIYTGMEYEEPNRYTRL